MFMIFIMASFLQFFKFCLTSMVIVAPNVLVTVNGA